MASSADSNRDPWGRSLTATLRRWWWIPVVLGLVGGVMGGLAGVSAPRTAEALLTVQVSGSDPQNVSTRVNTAVVEVTSRDVYTSGAARAGVDVRDFVRDVEVSAPAQTTFLSIRATHRDAETAARLANSMADAAVEASTARINEELAQLTRTTGVLITEQPLTDPAAEEQRVMRLGGQLADQQGQMLTQSNRLTLVQSAEAATVSSISTPLLAAMGLMGGVLAGVAIALVFGGRRGRMSSITEMRRVYPDLEFVPARELPTVMSMEASDVDRVVLTGVRAPAGAIRGLVEPVAAGFHAVGREVSVTEDLASFGRNGHDGRPRTATLLQTPLTSAIVKRTARDDNAMLLVLVRPHKTKFEWLDEYVHQFGDRACVVVDG